MIIEYFAQSEKELWKKQINGADWGAAKFLAELLDDDSKRVSLLGESAKLFMSVEGNKLISFATLTKKDCVDCPERYPWIGFVYTFPPYRYKGYCRHLLDYICEQARQCGYENIWVATDHADLYEHFGFVYVENLKDVLDDDESRVYYKKL